MGIQIRTKEIKRRQARQRKLRVLRAKHQASKSKDEQKEILFKMKKITPWLSEKELLLQEEK